VDPGPEPPDSAQLVSDLAERVPEVRHVLVVSADGVPLAVSRGIAAGHLGQLAAITSSLISLAAGTARILDSGGVTQAVVVMEHGTFVIMAVDAGASLAVLTTAAADLDQVAYEMTMLVERSTAVLSSPARGPSGDDSAGDDSGDSS
jgi:hypothetical protein